MSLCNKKAEAYVLRYLILYITELAKVRFIIYISSLNTIFR